MVLFLIFNKKGFVMARKRKPDNQGQRAAKAGAAFERYAQMAIEGNGGVLVTAIEAAYYLENPQKAPVFFYEKNKKYVTSIGKTGKTEFFLYIKSASETPEFSTEGAEKITSYRVECKTQTTGGTAEDKLGTCIERMMDIPGEKRSLILAHIPSVTVGVLKEIVFKARDLTTRSGREGNEICIMNKAQFLVFLREALGKTPVCQRKSTNGRHIRDQNSFLSAFYDRLISYAKKIYDKIYSFDDEAVINELIQFGSFEEEFITGDERINIQEMLRSRDTDYQSQVASLLPQVKDKDPLL